MSSYVAAQIIGLTGTIYELILRFSLGPYQNCNKITMELISKHEKLDLKVKI